MSPKLIFALDKLCNISTQCPFSLPYLSGPVGLTRGCSVLDGTFLHTDTRRHGRGGENTRAKKIHMTLAVMEAINHIQQVQTLKHRLVLSHGLCQSSSRHFSLLFIPGQVPKHQCCFNPTSHMNQLNFK